MMVDLDGEPYFIEQLTADETARVIAKADADLAAATDPIDAELVRLVLTALHQHADLLAAEQAAHAAFDGFRPVI